ncbi:MAG: HNH endonuclease [Sphingorhabdus sp.]|uniref:HNH endonuclease n=1 Tax=Sphingorhabdus sp. TaxID=1902408 RepID=UPI003C8132BE
MNAITKFSLADVDLAMCRHWSGDLPYRAVVAVSIQPLQGTILYQVAGDASTPRSAIKALKLATEKYGGICFYCKKDKAEEVSIELTIDHIEPQSVGGDSNLTNLVVACKPCNAKKGHQLIDAFNPAATEEWLLALAKQIQQRFDKLKAATPPS